jgi:hypothetical protein
MASAANDEMSSSCEGARKPTDSVCPEDAAMPQCGQCGGTYSMSPGCSVQVWSGFQAFSVSTRTSLPCTMALTCLRVLWCDMPCLMDLFNPESCPEEIAMPQWGQCGGTYSMLPGYNLQVWCGFQAVLSGHGHRCPAKALNGQCTHFANYGTRICGAMPWICPPQNPWKR